MASFQSACARSLCCIVGTDLSPTQIWRWYRKTPAISELVFRPKDANHRAEKRRVFGRWWKGIFIFLGIFFLQVSIKIEQGRKKGENQDVTSLFFRRSSVRDSTLRRFPAPTHNFSLEPNVSFRKFWNTFGITDWNRPIYRRFGKRDGISWQSRVSGFVEECCRPSRIGLIDWVLFGVHVDWIRFSRFFQTLPCSFNIILQKFVWFD